MPPTLRPRRFPDGHKACQGTSSSGGKLKQLAFACPHRKLSGIAVLRDEPRLGRDWLRPTGKFPTVRVIVSGHHFLGNKLPVPPLAQARASRWPAGIELAHQGVRSGIKLTVIFLPPRGFVTAHPP